MASKHSTSLSLSGNDALLENYDTKMSEESYAFSYSARVWRLALPDCCHMRLSLNLGFKFRVLLDCRASYGGFRR